MNTPTTLLQKALARWQHYVLMGRWKRARRIKGLVNRLQESKEVPGQVA